MCADCLCAVQTFFIVDSSAKDSKSARACESCYDTVFPLLEQPPDPAVTVTAGTIHSHFTLSGLKSMPSLLLNDVAAANSPSALMAIDLDSPKRALTRIEDESPLLTPDEPASPVVAAMRLRPAAARPKSYVQLLEEFQERDAAVTTASPTHSPRASRFSERSTMDETHGPLDERDEEALLPDHVLPEVVARTRSSPPVTPRREDTARRHKRFSLPAVALQTSPVTARPHSEGKGHHRFSLVLGRSASSAVREEDSPGRLRHSLVAGRLNELLGRGKD